SALRARSNDMSAPRAPESAPEASKALKATETRSFLISSSYVVLKGLLSASLRRRRSCPVACGACKVQDTCQSDFQSVAQNDAATRRDRAISRGQFAIEATSLPWSRERGYKGRSIAGVVPTMALQAT